VCRDGGGLWIIHTWKSLLTSSVFTVNSWRWVKLELEGFGIHDINNVQAVMLFNIGDAEMTVGELTLRGCYLGSNVSYNVKKMVENKYLMHERSVHDRRSIHVRLTEKGINCETA
jgi:DNA-binding MarR family transcriptional regulator